ncbi:alpha/beta fold hydrolase [Daejeonella oryzae]|uniref:alpha/beta fold hydrolase n=1 Tax=Daejeonella oryzae TaxID=1122943 RepID=UPI000412C44C|nr:alpha/beta hydrolase [Daejeonella oryzae]
MKTKLIWLIFLFLNISSLVRGEDRKITTSDSVNLFISIKGKGIPCLYIHGGPGSGSSWLEAFSGKMLESKFQMIYLDQRGVGRSSSPANSDYSLHRMLKDFEEIRQQLGIAKWIVLGHSFAGGIQTSYAANYPQSISGMIMLNGTVNIAESLKGVVEYTRKRVPTGKLQELDNTNLPLMNQMMICHQALGEDVYKMYYRDKASADTMNAVMAKISNWNHDFSSKVIAYSEYFQDFSQLTEKITVPVLVFSGMTDYAIGPEHHRLIRFPEQILVRANVGHLPFIEGKDDLEKAISRYLTTYFRSDKTKS